MSAPAATPSTDDRMSLSLGINATICNETIYNIFTWLFLDDIVKTNRAKVLNGDGKKKPKGKGKIAAKPLAKVLQSFNEQYGGILNGSLLQRAANKGKITPNVSVDNLTVQTAIKIAKAVGYTKAKRADAMDKVQFPKLLLELWLIFTFLLETWFESK